jgi:hypothetical protein
LGTGWTFAGTTHLTPAPFISIALKPEAHSLAVLVCRKGSLLLALPLFGACHLLFLGVAQATPTSSDTTTLSVVASSLDAIDCLAFSDTSNEESRQFTDDAAGSPYDCFIGPGPSVDRADRASSFHQTPLHFTRAMFDTVPSRSPRCVLRLGHAVSSFSQPVQEILERGPPDSLTNTK